MGRHLRECVSLPRSPLRVCLRAFAADLNVLVEPSVPNRLHSATFVAMFAVLTVLGFWCRNRSDAALVRASYDLVQRLSLRFSPPPDRPPVVIVYLDPASYEAEGLDPARPWDRALHARLVDRLSGAGARAVVFDVLFDRPGPDPHADRAFSEAIRRSGRVILAGEIESSSHSPIDDWGVRSHTLTLPTPVLAEAAAGVGLANLSPDPDFVVRRQFVGFDRETQPALAWAAARLLGLPGLVSITAPLWVRYYGPAVSLPHVSYTHALDRAATPDSMFHDRVVFVGARPRTGAITERRDEFRNPLPASGEDLWMPAVEVHATQLLNLMRQDGLRRLADGTEAVLLAAIAFMLALGVVRLGPWPAFGVALVSGVLLAGGAVAGLRQGVWGAWLVPAMVQIPAALAAAWLLGFADWYRTRRELEAERRRAGARIREQAALIDKAQDAILVRDLRDRVVYANPSAVRLYGWTLEALGEPCALRTLLEPARDQAAAALAAVTLHGEWQGELAQATHSGDLLRVDCRWTLIRDQAGHPNTILMIHTDVTERRRLESQLLRTQRLQTVWALAGGMAHDLNSALSPVLLGVQRLRDRLNDDASRPVLDAIEAGARRGAAMVGQVLAFARGRDDTRELIDPGTLLRELERILSQSLPSGIRLDILTPPDLWPVLGNATQLQQVLLNLCLNARDAMPHGGDLTVAADNVSLDDGEARDIPGGRPGDHLMVLVADTGAGMSPEVLGRLFEPFFTTKAPDKGTGLGLATSLQIVRGHGGFLHVRSEPGVGTTFELYLPKPFAPTANGPAAV
jgi:PAS domain S-box-containing protein